MLSRRYFTKTIALALLGAAVTQPKATAQAVAKTADKKLRQAAKSLNFSFGPLGWVGPFVAYRNSEDVPE